ncbi:MAG: hypothetical protein HGB12_13625 [Bacteroidetes bacterium]|nr:hypothetical protein [Bacteroidota bacterium]
MDILEHFDHQGKKQNKEHFTDLIQIAMADGIIDHKESEMLHRIGKKMGFTETEIDDLIEETSKSVFNPPYEFSKRFEHIYNIVKMILVDGVIDKNEMRLANGIATKLSFSENEIPNLLVLLISGIREGKDEEDLFEAYKIGRKV